MLTSEVCMMQVSTDFYKWYSLQADHAPGDLDATEQLAIFQGMASQEVASVLLMMYASRTTNYKGRDIGLQISNKGLALSYMPFCIGLPLSTTLSPSPYRPLPLSLRRGIPDIYPIYPTQQGRGTSPFVHIYPPPFPHPLLTIMGAEF